MSAAPSIASARIDSQGMVETPNTTVKTPNSATKTNMMMPAWSRIGWPASQIATTIAPMPGAARSRPRPHGPSSRMSRA